MSVRIDLGQLSESGTAGRSKFSAEFAECRKAMAQIGRSKLSADLAECRKAMAQIGPSKNLFSEGAAIHERVSESLKANISQNALELLREAESQHRRIAATKDRRIATLEARCEQLELECESLTAQLENERQSEPPQPSQSGGWLIEI